MKEIIWDWNKMKNSYWSTPAECSYYYLNNWKQKNINSVLDIGAGIGRHSILFAQHNFSVTAFDSSKTGLEYIDSISIENDLNIKTVQGNMHKLPFLENSFDAIFAYHSIYHTEQNELQVVVDEIYRVLKNNGEALVTMLSKEDYNYQNNQGEKTSFNIMLKKDGKEGPMVPHYYIDYDEIFNIFNNFNIINIKKVFEYHNNQNLCHYFLHLKK